MTIPRPKEGAANRVGRVRLPTPKEDADPDCVFHANAVLSLRESEAVLPPLERHVAQLIDGFRPVARLRKKAGLSSDELIDALRALRARGLLVLTGIIEESADHVPVADDSDDVEATVPHGANDVIPPHVMREIQTMLDEEDELRRQELSPDDADEFENETTTSTKH